LKMTEVIDFTSVLFSRFSRIQVKTPTLVARKLQL
jgi:hypothetical protein